MSDSVTQRHQLRTRLKGCRQALSTKDRQTYSKHICDRALPLLNGHAHIALYYSVGAEVDLSELMQRCELIGQQCYVPMVQPQHRMNFAPVDSNTTLTFNQYGIKEPDLAGSKLVLPDKLDAVVVPLVGFDNQCNRMGMGGGYYDRCFSHRLDPSSTRPLLIGVAFEVQHTESVFAQDWDVPLDHVITENRVISR